MRYMLLQLGTLADWQVLGSLAAADREAHRAFLRDLDRQLLVAGELVRAIGLVGPEAGKIVRAQPGGTPAVTPARFGAGQEFLAGCWIVDCDSPARVTEIAARVSAAPGRAGVALDLPVEVRVVMRAPGEEM